MTMNKDVEKKQKNYDILIVDDEQDICELISDVLRDEGYQTRLANTGKEALDSIADQLPSLVILDIWLNDPDYDGIKLLDHLVQEYPNLPILMMSGHGTIETAVSAIKIGAYDFVEKPFKSDRLLLMIRRAIEAYEMAQENQELRAMLGEIDELIGSSSAVKQLRLDIERIAPTNSRVLITGASGSGKEVVARQIHELSPRHKGAFIMVNCGALTLDTFEEKLFGVEPKADGTPRKIGLFERAHRGTILLDEITDLPKEIQAKLVRVLHEMAIERVGGTRKIKVDARVLSTTTQDIQELVQNKVFREDLYYRINVVNIKTPSLAERREDIPTLVYYFSERLGGQLGKTPCQFDEKALALLKGYDWPGNARQLKNVIEHVLILHGQTSDQVLITSEKLPSILSGKLASGSDEDIPFTPNSNVLQLPLREARETFEREYLIAQVDRFAGNISQTATFVGMERSALHRKLRNLQVRRIK